LYEVRSAKSLLAGQQEQKCKKQKLKNNNVLSGTREAACAASQLKNCRREHVGQNGDSDI